MLVVFKLQAIFLMFFGKQKGKTRKTIANKAVIDNTTMRLNNRHNNARGDQLGRGLPALMGC